MPGGEHWGSQQMADNPVSGVGIASERARHRARGRRLRGSSGTPGRPQDRGRVQTASTSATCRTRSPGAARGHLADRRAAHRRGPRRERRAQLRGRPGRPRPHAGRALPWDTPQPPHSDQRHQQDQLLIDTLSPRAVLRFGEPYLTGHELDDSGGGWRDGLARARRPARAPGRPGPHPDRARAARPRHPVARRQAAVRRSGGRRARPAAAARAHAARLKVKFTTAASNGPGRLPQRIPGRPPGDNRHPPSTTTRRCASWPPRPTWP
jgi:hypothetical protein